MGCSGPPRCGAVSASAFRSRWRLFVCLFVCLLASRLRPPACTACAPSPSCQPIRRCSASVRRTSISATALRDANGLPRQISVQKVDDPEHDFVVRRYANKPSPRRHRPLWRGRVPSRTHAAVCRWASIVTNVRLTLRWVQADPTDFILYVPDCTDAKKLRAKVSPPIFRQRRMPRAPQQRGVAWHSQ